MNTPDAADRTLQAEERYRLLVDAIIDYAVYMLDPDGTVVSWNTGAQRFKGYTANEIVGSHFSLFYTDSDRNAGLPERGLKNAAEKGRFETEGWRVRKDGTRFWAHVIIDPIRTAEGTLLGFAKVTRDLTEKRAAEETLRQSEEQLRLLIEGVTDYAIYLLSAEGCVTNWNAGAQRIKGYAPQEIIGEHFSRFYTDEDQAAGRPNINLALAAREGRLEEEGWRVRKDGTRFMAHVVIDVIRDDNGRVTGFAKVTRDVTERYETQKALEQTREELFQARKMEAVGRLTGGVAHDFNNLLTVILISLELARKRLPGSPVLELIDNAIQGAERGASMTRRMLAFSRRQPLKLEAVSVPELVLGMHSLIKQSIETNITVNTHFALGLPHIKADAHQLESALLNLVFNARDAMPEGGTITLSARPTNPADLRKNEAATPSVLLEVTDTGEGMDADTLEKAIDPFFTTKGVGKGTGLGLSMVHGIVEQLGGKLRLKSIKGSGTTIQLWLPIADAPSGHTPETAEQPDNHPELASLRILVVDDDELVLINTCALLQELGHQPLRAASAAGALAILQTAEVDLVITDHAMPGMTGSQLLAELAKTHPTLPVILASGYAEVTDGDATAVPTLAKPFDERGLSLAIRRAMG
ncbi:MAG: PAS domain S-box protein [Halopseudomonas sp.]|uniref:hybrid sensor histidine kinase/response regulator n=1 Tax=Halopseudomonas sp. TaxID=2901191 RepID=UPI003001E442